MASKIKLKNQNGVTLTLENNDNALTDKVVSYFDTVLELTGYVGTDGDVLHVSDKDRGGIFIYDSTATDNGGTVFGKCVRQYSGAVNVKWFGAKGDGVTDDTESIQSAIDAVYKISDYSQFNETNEVYREAKVYTTPILISNGVYLVRNTLSVYNGTVIQGESTTATKILPSVSFNGTKVRNIYSPEGTDTCSFIFDSRQTTASEWTWGIEIKNISIANVNGVASLGGINLTHSHKYIVENCSFSNMKYGVYLYGAWSGTLSRITTHYCNVAGLYLDFIDGDIDTEVGSNQECNAITITDCFIEYGNNYGIRLDRCNGVEIIGGAIQRCGKDGIYSDGINKGISITTYFEGNCRILDSSDTLYNESATLSDYYDINLGKATEYLWSINSIFFSKLHRCIGVGYVKHLNIKAFNFLNTTDAKAILHFTQPDTKSIVIEQIGYDPNTTPTEGIIQNSSGQKDIFSTPLKASWFTYGNDILRVDHINYAYAASVEMDKDLICNNGVLTVQTKFEGNNYHLTAQVINTPVLTVNADYCDFRNINFKSASGTTSGTIVSVSSDGDRCKFDRCKFSGVSTTGAITVISGAPNITINDCRFELGTNNRALKTSSSNIVMSNCSTQDSAVIYIETTYNYFTNMHGSFTFTDTTGGKVNFIDNKLFKTTTPTHIPSGEYDAIVYKSDAVAGGSVGWVYTSTGWKTFGTIGA